MDDCTLKDAKLLGGGCIVHLAIGLRGIGGSEMGYGDDGLSSFFPEASTLISELTSFALIQMRIQRLQEGQEVH